MIASLRRRHRVMIFLLVIPILAVFIFGLSVRKEVPVVSEFPPTGLVSPSSPGSVLGVGNDLFSELPIDVRLFDRTGDEPYFLQFEVRESLKKPDLLVYWVAQASSSTGVPADAILLGSLGGTGLHWFPLPSSAAENDGSLLLYSLAHQSRIALAEFPTVAAVSKGGNL